MNQAAIITTVVKWLLLVFSAVSGAALQLLNIAPDANDSRITKVSGVPNAG